MAFGVMLPVIAIFVELVTRVCATTFFNPLPSLWAAGLAGSVPLANFVLWLRPVGLRWMAHPVALALMNALALVIAAFYSLCFLPMAPLGLLALVFAIGLLPLSPMFALWVAIRQRRALGREPGVPRLHLCLIPAVTVGLLAAAPGFITHFGLVATLSPSEASRNRAIWTLRTFGDDDRLLGYCFNRSVPVVSLFSRKVSAEHARKIYFIVTGSAFDSKPNPIEVGLLSGEFWDTHQGGAAVGKQLSGLGLGSSRLDGSVDTAAGLGYLEWTLEFHNSSNLQREARTLIQLPAGAVVSRATLWINGEEREAAFGRREQVRAAYERIVRARRDPLLATTSGPGRVLVQCFPIQPSSSMRIRLGITSPLESDRMALPYFLERNFETSRSSYHAVWIDGGGASVRRSLDDAGLFSPVVLPDSHRAAAAAWTPDPADPDRFHVQQRLVAQPLPRYSRLVVVIDGSSSLASLSDQIQAQLTDAAKKIPLNIVLAGDKIETVAHLHRSLFAGGRDNVPALHHAQTLAAADPGAAILWIHGPQPVILSSTDPLHQFWTRRPGVAPLYAVQLVAGHNRVLAQLDGVAAVRLLQVPVERLFEHFTSASNSLTPERVRLAGPKGDGHRTSAHLARLWAHQEILRLPESGERNARQRAIDLAMTYHLVTPLTGAVVLETKQQYDQAGLRPADAAQVPTIPEPETWALLAVGLAVVMLTVQRRRGRTW